MRKSLTLASAALVLGALALVQSPTRSAPLAGNVTVDAVHSSVIFRIQHNGAAMFYGRFNQIAGMITLVEGGTGAIDLTVDVESVDTANEGRDKHLKSPDFFNAAQFPEITFQSESMKHLGGSKYEATGSFSMHGVTKEITVAIEHTGTGQNRQGASVLGFETTFTVKRSDYGMNFMQGPIGDEVRLIVSIEGVLASK